MVFFQEPQERDEFEAAVVHVSKSSVFDPFKFFCILFYGDICRECCPDQTSGFAVSDLGLHCFPLFLI